MTGVGMLCMLAVALGPVPQAQGQTHAHAQTQAHAHTQAHGQALAKTQVRATTVQGQDIEGVWSGVDSAGRLVLVHQGQPQALESSQFMAVRWLARAPHTSPATNPATQPGSLPTVEVFLADGGQLHARIMAASQQRIELQTVPVPRLILPWSSLAAVRFARQTRPDAQQAFERALAERDASQDVLLVVNDERVTTLRGVTESLTAEGGTFRWRDRTVPIRSDRAYGLVFAAGVERPRPPPARCLLDDGSIWCGRITGGDTAAVQLELAGGTMIRLAVAELSEIRFHSDRVVFLSDLEPAEYVFEPFGTTRWPYRKDRSVANRPIRIGNRAFDRGLGMHSQSKLVYNLAEPFTHLAAVVGIDAAVGALGNVVFRVLADNQEVFNSGPVTGRDGPRPILVPSNHAKQLQLIVDFGEDLDVGDQADWADARLIR